MAGFWCGLPLSRAAGGWWLLVLPFWRRPTQLLGTSCSSPKGCLGDFFPFSCCCMANIAGLAVLQLAGKVAHPHFASRYDRTCWVKACCLKNYLLTLSLLLPQGQHTLALSWGRAVDLSQPHNNQGFALGITLRNGHCSSAALDTAGQKNAAGEAYSEISDCRKPLWSAGSKHVLVKELDYLRRWLTQ